MKKLMLFTLLLGIFTSTVSCGGGDGVNNYTTTYAKKVSETTKSQINDSVETEQKEITEPATEVPEKLLNIQEARQFNNGVAWVKSDNGWNIVDTEGNIVKTFSDIYKTTDFIGGYSVATVMDELYYYDGYINPKNQIIVNVNGEIVFDVLKEGYDGLYSYDGIDIGSVVVMKNLDSFDKSGDYYLHYDLNTKTEKEIFHNYPKVSVNYVGNGFYTISDDYYDDEARKELFVFHNYINDNTISFDNEDIINDLSYDNWTTYKMNNFIFGFVKYSDSYDNKIFTFDLQNKQYNSLSINEHFTSKPLIKTCENMAVLGGWLGGIYACDLKTNQYIEFKPNCDYECDIQDYDNGYFFVTTENENRTEFFTVIDWNMNPLFTPKRYSDTTTFIKDYIVYNEENGTGTIMYIPDNAVIKEFPDSEIIYTDKSNLYVWVRNNDNTVECFDIKTGNQILKLDGAYDILTDFSDGLVAVNSTEMNEKSYINMSGEKLKITE